jgi:hypothetical protein
VCQSGEKPQRVDHLAAAALESWWSFSRPCE